MMDERYTTHGIDGGPPDDLDHLMARLTSPQPPATLIPQILARTVETSPAFLAAERRVRAVLWSLYGVTLALVLACAVLFGQALHGTGTLDFVALGLQDMDLVRTSPGLFWSALAEHMPWWHLTALGGALLAWVVTATALLRRRTLPRPPTGFNGQPATGAVR